MKVFMEADKIIGNLKSRDCKEALNWCKDFKSKLDKNNVFTKF